MKWGRAIKCYFKNTCHFCAKSVKGLSFYSLISVMIKEYYKYRIPITERRFVSPVMNIPTNLEEIQAMVKADSRSLQIDDDMNIKEVIRGVSFQRIAGPEDILIFRGGSLQAYKSEEGLLKDYKEVRMFGKEDRSSFRYWFAHWAGFNLVALNLGVWKFKYLFHDWEKPWMKLWYRGDYKKVQTRHRLHNKHHLEYGLLYGWNKLDAKACVIDWECCGLSKRQAQLDARETLEYEVGKDKWKPYEKEIRAIIEPVLREFGL